MHLKYKIAGGDFSNAGNAASSVKKILKQLNIAPLTAKRIVVALYEGEVNIVAHAWSGIINVTIDSERIAIVLDDAGPGISDIEQAMQEGFSTAGPRVREMGFGAGMGLPNMKKNTDSMTISSVPGRGTKVELVNYLDKNAY